MKTSNALQTNVVFIAKNDIFTDSLIVAREFGKEPKNVLRAIDNRFKTNDDELTKFGRLNFEPSEYLNEQGKSQRKYNMTEDGFLELVMSFTGDKARKVRVRFIAAFRELRCSILNPPRAEIMDAKRKEALPMTNTKKFTYELLGMAFDGKTESIKEHKFCNRALGFGYNGLEESTLDNYDLKFLGAIRAYNAILIPHYPKQKDKAADGKSRYELMEAFVADYRAKHPRLTLATLDGNLLESK